MGVLAFHLNGGDASNQGRSTAAAAQLLPVHVQAAIPKQYLELKGQPIATYSMRTFAAMPEIGEVVVVCEPEWR